MSLKFPISLTGKRGGGIPEPLHWWDLDSLTTGLDDQGTSPWPRLNAKNNPTTLSVGPDGQSVMHFSSNGRYLEYKETNGSMVVGWDGVSDTEMSYSFWFKSTSISSQSNRLLVWRQDGGQTLITQTFVKNASPDYTFGMVWDENNLALRGYDETISSELATWYHCVGVLKDKTFSMYIDNQLIGTETNASFTKISRTPVPFTIATASWDRGSPQFQHKGMVGMVGMWDTALTEESISHLYNNGSGRQYADL